jgi:membrane-associated phospholipid phosphatase
MFPAIDLKTSAWFYDGAGFPDLALAERTRDAARFVEAVVAAAFLAPLVARLVLPERRPPFRPRDSLFGLLALALGPGLLVNGILKEVWGRARPREILEFGGDATFTPVWWLSDQCDGNCSFVSGEAAAAFWVLSLAFVVPPAWRRLTASVAIAFAGAVSLARLAAGGHFLSDVLLAWLMVLLVLVLLDRLILRGLPARFDLAVEARLADAGRALRRMLAPGRRSAP